MRYGKSFHKAHPRYILFRKESAVYQVNPVQTEVLYNKAIEFAGLTGKERVIDAYSGIGTIGMVASDNAGEVISVELNGDAVLDAIFYAKQNKVKNIRFYKEDAVTGSLKVFIASSTSTVSLPSLLMLFTTTISVSPALHSSII